MKCSEKILICDDEPSTVRLVKVHCQRLGMEVITASDGNEAMHLLKTERPRAVILDVVMPLMDGYEVLNAIRNDPDLEGTFVVMLTAMAQDEDVRNAYQLGADLYLSKPFDPAVLDRLLQLA